MTLRVSRPLCKRPVLGFWVNLVLCGLFLNSAPVSGWSDPMLLLPSAFGIATLIFCFLSVVRLETVIEFSEDSISRSGKWSGGKIEFSDIAEARIERDIGEQQYKWIHIQSRDGKSLRIDPRFINPDRDEIVEFLKERLALHGIELTKHRVLN